MEKSQKILSVSVASYNLGEMIVTNIESFCKSSVAEDIELIITDDGSKDDTPKIIETYAEKYPNVIKFIKKQNEGPGSTVNSGIMNATGKYFRMVDGDDWVRTENLSEYIDFLKKSDADMVASDYEIYDNSQDKVIQKISFQITPNKTYNFNEVCTKIPSEMHATTFKTSILKDKHIILDNGFYTDVEYMLFPMQFVETVAYFDKVIYVYRVAQAAQSVNPNSMKKNINQHDIVLKNLIKTYSVNKGALSLNKRKYISNRIGIMADTQLGTLLLFDANIEKKKEIKLFLKNMKKGDCEVYKKLKKGMKYRILSYSGFMLYPLLSKVYKKRKGLLA